MRTPEPSRTVRLGPALAVRVSLNQVEIRSRDDVSSNKNRTICRIIFFLCGVALTNQHQSIFIILPIIIEIWITEITSFRGFALGEMMIFLCFGMKSIT